MHDPKCHNCGNAESEHSKFDTHCLLVMNWKAEDFEPAVAGASPKEGVRAQKCSAHI